jgi:NIMA (never in mitosis gene a)-related kinase
MAPECVQSVPYTYKSDLWSLGCVLYEMAMLKHAFDAGNLLSLVYQIVRGTYPPLPPQRYSPQLSALVQSLLANNPADRPSVTTVLQMPWLQQHMASAQHRW